MFQGFPEETIRFFLDLRFHNDPSWFYAHRDEYEKYVKKPFQDFVEELAPSLQMIDPQMEIRPARCVARIHRDIRFSKDKSPYRDHLWTVFWRTGEAKDQSVMYWFELSPESVNWGLGFWGRNRPAMDVLRSFILQYPSKVMEAMIKSELFCNELVLCGEQYSKKIIPESVPKDLVPFYLKKECYFQRNGVPVSLAYSPDLTEAVISDYLKLHPMYSLLREAADVANTQYDQ